MERVGCSDYTLLIKPDPLAVYPEETDRGMREQGESEGEVRGRVRENAKCTEGRDSEALEKDC